MSRLGRRGIWLSLMALCCRQRAGRPLVPHRARLFYLAAQSYQLMSAINILHGCLAISACASISLCRPHKSNGIYIVVDLREGSWHQKCYDPGGSRALGLGLGCAVL